MSKSKENSQNNQTTTSSSQDPVVKLSQEQLHQQLVSHVYRTQIYLLIVIAALALHCCLSFYQQTPRTTVDDNGSNNEIQQLQEKIETLQNKLHIARTKPATSKDELREYFSLNALIDKARKATPTVWFSSNQSNIDTITEVAKKVISEDYYSCRLDLDVQFDPYKNCFRDLSIEFHNRLTLKIANSHFFTSVGRVQYSFFITTMLSKRNEYMFGLGDIVFEVLEYPELLSANIKDVNEEEEDIDIVDTTFDDNAELNNKSQQDEL